MIAGGEIAPKAHQTLKPGCLGVALFRLPRCLTGFTRVRLLGSGKSWPLELLIV